MSTQLSNSLEVAPQNLFDIKDTAATFLGSLVHTNDGRAFRYGKAGASDLKTGILVQAAAETTANQNLTAVAAAIGDTSLVSTTTITATANQYAGGLAIITTGPGIGRAYQISGHAAFTAAAPTFKLADPIAGVALTTSSRIDLVENPFSGVIINPTTLTSAPIAVSMVATVTAAYFAWFQVAGVAPILADGTLTVGQAVVASNGTAGTVEAAPAGAVGSQPLVGTAFTGVATTEVGAVKLQGLL